MFRSRLRAPRIISLAARPQQLPRRRFFHQIPLPQLTHHADFLDGVPGLLSRDGFQIAWTDYMTLVLGRLSYLIAGKELEGKDPQSIVLATAREPQLAPIFNHASMAYNNHFFFKNLSPWRVDVPQGLKDALEKNFGSLENLRREFVVTANAMFGPGFVWLVKADLRHTGLGANNYRILTTYLAGTPLPGAHYRQQSVDMNTVGERSPEAQKAAMEYLSKAQSAVRPRSAAGVVGAGGGGVAAATEDESLRPPGGVKITPLLCLNTWEHVWLRDYGFGLRDGEGGKNGFVEAWWDTINWENVSTEANITNKAFQS